MSEEAAEKDMVETTEAVVEEAAEAGAEVAAEAVMEPGPEPEAPAVPEISRIRQWVTLRGSSMDARVGFGIVDQVAKDLRSAIGKPHGCILVHEKGAPKDKVDQLARDLSAQGFQLAVSELVESPRTLAGVEAFSALLAEAAITSDDVAVVVGSLDTLSLASFACARWCGGVSLCELPLDLVSAIVAGVTPAPLDAAGVCGALEQEGTVRFSVMDTALFGFDPTTEEARLAFAHMVATAMCDTDKAFGRLWDQADPLVAGDLATLVAQLADTVKSRGKVISSTALSTRQSIRYGQDFAAALGSLVGGQVAPSALLADGMRFSARLSAAQGLLSIDDMFAQDELLERLGVGACQVPVDPDALVDALKAQIFGRSRRFMLAIPRAIGRVRLSSVEDELLREHVAAWAAAR